MVTVKLEYQVSSECAVDIRRSTNCVMKGFTLHLTDRNRQWTLVLSIFQKSLLGVVFLNLFLYFFVFF